MICTHARTIMEPVNWDSGSRCWTCWAENTLRQSKHCRNSEHTHTHSVESDWKRSSLIYLFIYLLAEKHLDDVMSASEPSCLRVSTRTREWAAVEMRDWNLGLMLILCVCWDKCNFCRPTTRKKTLLDPKFIFIETNFMRWLSKVYGYYFNSGQFYYNSLYLNSN